MIFFSYRFETLQEFFQLLGDQSSTAAFVQVDDLGISDSQAFAVINNGFDELNAQSGSFSGDLFVILFTSGKTVERFLHKTTSMLQDVNKSRMRVLVNWGNQKFGSVEMENLIKSHMISVIAPTSAENKNFKSQPNIA